MSDIPTDLFCVILKRVLVEDLFRFRSVCKAWRHIIDDPSFAKSHFNRGLGETNWLTISDKITRKVFLLPLIQMLSENTRIECVQATTAKLNTMPGIHGYIPARRGLLLASCKSEEDVINWFIWNPFTGESLDIPQCDERPPECDNDSDPFSGYGYDKANDDYKIVCVFPPSTCICVYSLRLNSWRKMGYHPNCDESCMGIGEIANGAFYWVDTCWLGEEDDDDDVGRIGSLDLSKKKYYNIPFPKEIDEVSRCGLVLHVLGENLFLSCFNLRECYVLWMFKGENTWVEVVSIKLEDYDCYLYPIAYLEGEKQIVFGSNKSMCLWYNIAEKSLKEVLLHFLNDANDQTNEGIENRFDFRVSPASLVRLSRTCEANEGVSSEVTPGMKRIKAPLDVPGRLGLKTILGPPKRIGD